MGRRFFESGGQAQRKQAELGADPATDEGISRVIT